MTRHARTAPTYRTSPGRIALLAISVLALLVAGVLLAVQAHAAAPAPPGPGHTVIRVAR
jgi:hypothetical protein